MKFEKHDEPDNEPPVSRRALLKVIAGAPLTLTFALLASPLARFCKPTMEPGGFFQESDIPTIVQDVQFHMNDFPDDWTCIPFFCHLKYVVFNPEQAQLRRIPGFIIRTAPGKIVAYSRFCRCGRVMNYVSAKGGCGCGHCGMAANACHCALSQTHGPAIACPFGHTIFSLDEERALVGYRPRQFKIIHQDDSIKVAGIEHWSISS